MPNGRSGGFYISREKLEGLLLAMSPDTVIDKSAGATVTVAEALALLAKDGRGQVLIEEQEHAWYIIHLSTWIAVNESSPLHGGLRRGHSQGLKEFPPSAPWERVGDHVRGPLIAVKFGGTYPPGSAGNDFAQWMVRCLRRVLAETGAAGVILDLSELDYSMGDAIGGLAAPLMEAGCRRPAAIVANGSTARALEPLLAPNYILGVAGIKLFSTREDALARLRRVLDRAPSGATVGFPKLRRKDRDRNHFAHELTCLQGIVGIVLAVAGPSILRSAPEPVRRRGFVLLVSVMFLVLTFTLWGEAWVKGSNAIRRYRWARRFPRRMGLRELRTVLAPDPGRFVVHVRSFGEIPVPAAVLEDTRTGELAAVYPPSWRVAELCAELDVPVLESAGE